MADAASVIGDLQVRNRGTIGGSVAHADPAADLPVILTALDASFAVRSPTASRTIAVDDFFTDFYTTAMNSDEILTEIHVPIPAAGTGSAYAKLPHPASGYVVVSAGALITRQAFGHLRVRAHCHRRIGQRPGPRGRHRDRIAGQTAHSADDRRGGRQGG